jgi:hypothetical protein
MTCSSCPALPVIICFVRMTSTNLLRRHIHADDLGFGVSKRYKKKSCLRMFYLGWRQILSFSVYQPREVFMVSTRIAARLINAKLWASKSQGA